MVDCVEVSSSWLLDFLPSSGRCVRARSTLYPVTVDIHFSSSIVFSLPASVLICSFPTQSGNPEEDARQAATAAGSSL